MKRAVVVAALLGVGVLAGWLMAGHLDVREQRAAIIEAEHFLQRRAMTLDQFFGPVVVDRADAKRTFSWIATNRAPVLQLDVSPMGDMVCLYEVSGVRELKKLQCEELR